MRNLWTLTLACVFTIESLGQVTSPFLKDTNLGDRNGFEYFVGRDLGSPLITVNLISGVREPGVYHVPVNTDLAELVSYAGGVTENADLSDIRIRRNRGSAIKLIEYDLREEFKDKSVIMVVQDRDVIHIPYKNNLDSTIKWTSLVATLVSILASIVLINEYKRNN